MLPVWIESAGDPFMQALNKSIRDLFRVFLSPCKARNSQQVTDLFIRRYLRTPSTTKNRSSSFAVGPRFLRMP